MRRLRVWIVLLGTGLGVASAQNGSVPAPAPPDPQQISLNVQVEDGSGQPVRGLTRDQITLSEDGTARPLTGFAAVENGAASARMILVLDAVNVPYTALASERSRLSDYLKKHPDLPVPTTLGVLTNTGVQVYPEYTRSGKAMSDQVEHADISLRLINRSAGFYGATERLDDSLKGLGALVESSAQRGGRTLLVFLSPGWPLLSGPEVELSGKEQTRLFQLIVRLNTQMRTGGVTLYDVNGWGPLESPGRYNYYKTFLKGVEKPEQVTLGDVGLQVISTQSGGFSAPPSNDVGKALDKVYADGTAWYRVSFAPTPDDGPNRYHAIKVEDAGNPARTTQGFYGNATAEPK